MPSTPSMPSKGSARRDKGAAPSSPTANAASARNTAVAGEVILRLIFLLSEGAQKIGRSNVAIDAQYL